MQRKQIKNGGKRVKNLKYYMLIISRALWRGDVELFVPAVGDGEQEKDIGAIVRMFFNKETAGLSLQGPGRSIM